MAKNGCGEFVGLANLYSSDGLMISQMSHGALKESDKRYSTYNAKVDNSLTSNSFYTEYQQGCECAANASANTSSSYNSEANSVISASVDNYGSIIIKNKMKSKATSNSSENIEDNTTLLYCAPDPDIYTFKQNGSNNCTNNNGTTPFKCESVCTTSITQTVLVQEGNKWKKKSVTETSNDPCTPEAPYGPSGGPGYKHDADEETKQSYSKNENINDEWQSSENCSSGSYNYVFSSKIDKEVTGEVNISTVQGIRSQAISRRLQIYEKNQAQNEQGDKCGPNEYSCWSFISPDDDDLYVDEELYSWKLRVKGFVHKEGLPTDVNVFKANVHLYSVPSVEDEYGDLHPAPGYYISNCTCGSPIGPEDTLPFKKLALTVRRDGDTVTWGNTKLILGSTTADIESSEAPIQQSFIFYCTEDTTFS